MTAATTAGYTVDASRYGASYDPFKAFNGLKGGSSGDVGWHTGTATPPGISDYTGTNNTYVGTERLSSETVLGEWITIELPNPIKLIDTHLWAQFNYAHVPKGGVFYGKRNASDTWTQLYSYTGQAIVDRYHPQVHTINETRYFKYFAYVATERYLSGSGISVGEWELYGHEEGDESVDVVHRSVPNKPGQQQLAVYWDANDSNSYSFADSSNVYDLSGSGVTGAITGTNGFDAEYNAWVFDGSGDYIDATLSNPSQDWVHSTSFWYRQDSVVTATWDYLYHIGTSTNGGAALFALKSDGYLAFANYGLASVRQTFTPTLGKWYHFTIVYSGGGVTTDNVSIYLDGKILLSTYNQGDGSSVSLSANTNIRLGASNSVSAGNATHGSIANFRLFSKTLNADQVRELYEYDAPRFGHRTNVVALHKGNLGVGVTAPTSRFEVAGREDLQEYPPKAMTGYETYMEGHGVFRVSQSSEGSANGVGGAQAWKAFDDINDATNDNYWNPNHGLTNHRYGGTDGIYTGIHSFQANSDSSPVGGEWLKIEFPHKFKLNNLVVQGRYNYTGAPGSGEQNPTDFRIIGSNDDSNWYILKTVTNQTGSQYPGTTNTIDTSHPPYKYYVFHVTHNAGSIAMSVGGLQFFGTPAPSGLEDGHLTLGKALTAPRFTGHAAGAETPRAESLVVHYDTTVDSVASGSTVVDISGQGNNGTLNGNATYSSSDRALTFDGVNDYVKGTIPSSLSGNHTYSFSMWVKPNAIQTGYIAAFEMGNRTNNQSCGLYFNGGVIVHLAFANNLISTTSVVVNQWIHIVGTYTSGSRKIYADGVLLGSDAYSSMNIGSTEMTLGANNDDDQEFNGSISNFKLYDVALTADEVAAEYALGRTGKSLNVTDTAVCLGGTVPRAQLDVRGGARFDGRVGIGSLSPTGQLQITSSTSGGVNADTMDTQLVLASTGDNYNPGSVGAGIMFAQRWYNAASSVAGCCGIYSVKRAGNGAFGGDMAFYTGPPSGNFNMTEKMRIMTSGNVGIGTVSPRFTTEVYNGGLAVFSDGNATWQAGIASATNQGLIIGRTGSNPINGTSSKYWQLNMHSNDNLHVSFAGQYSGYVSKGTQNDQMNANFTGQHRTFIKDVPFTQASDLEGLIVSADQNKYIKMSGGVEAGSNAITMNESLPVVSLSTTSNDKNCFGVVSTVEDPDVRKEQHGIFGSIMRKEVGDTRVYINSVGEGAIWVVNINGPLESGDYITTSNVAGYGMKQDSEFLANYTVAKITMDCDFNPATQPIQRIVKELGNENHWVKTTVSNVTLEEYSNLTDENRTTTIETVYTNEEGEIFTEQDEQSTYTELTRTIYKKIHREESKTEQEGWDLEVRQELVNVLDEHGQLQWEDTEETEKAYKIRYLDASGQITDEANAVHIAAFVGCTYHCG